MLHVTRRVLGRMALATALYAAASTAALAAEWRVDPEASRLDITYIEDDEAQSGLFERFSGEARFDTTHPEAARLTLTIDIESIALADRFRSEFVQSEAWFDRERYPTAQYELTSLTLIEGSRYASTGVLTIKGRSLPIETPITLELSETEAIAEGALSFDRLDFGLGDTVGGFIIDIGRAIEVRFRFVAQRG